MQDAAEGVDVAGRPDWVAEGLFAGHVGGAADGYAELGEFRQGPGAVQERHPEVDDLYLPVGVHHHVVRLDVAVHDVDPVPVGQGGGGLRRHRRAP